MGRPKVSINPAWAENLRRICKEQGITQAQLAGDIYLSQQTLSKIMQGKASLTSRNAEAIIKLFPEYRFNGLMGYDDCLTEEEYEAQRILDRAFYAFDEREATNALLALHGYKEIRREKVRTSSPVQVLVTVEDENGETCQINSKDFDRVVHDIAWYAKARMQRLFEEERGDIDG